MKETQAKFFCIADVCADSPALNAVDEMIACLRKLEKLLEASGYLPEDVVHAILILSDMNDFGEVNEIYNGFFDFTLPPSRVCISSNVKPCHVKLSVILQERGVERRGIHVQSRSFWAPPNIGPYSQSREYEGNIYASGQIGLNPSTMVLLSDPQEQSAIAIRHLMRVLRTRNCNYLGGLVGFVKSKEDAKVALNTWNDKVGDLDDEFNYSSVCLIVAVEGLPRNAKVEWYSLLATNKYEDYSDFDKLELHRPGGIISCIKAVNGENLISLAFFGCEKKLLKKQLDTFVNAAIKKTIENLSVVSSLYLFHRSDLRPGEFENVVCSIPCSYISVPGQSHEDIVFALVCVGKRKQNGSQ